MSKCRIAKPIVLSLVFSLIVSGAVTPNKVSAAKQASKKNPVVYSDSKVKLGDDETYWSNGIDFSFKIKSAKIIKNTNKKVAKIVLDNDGYSVVGKAAGKTTVTVKYTGRFYKIKNKKVKYGKLIKKTTKFTVKVSEPDTPYLYFRQEEEYVKIKDNYVFNLGVDDELDVIDSPLFDWDDEDPLVLFMDSNIIKSVDVSSTDASVVSPYFIKGYDDDDNIIKSTKINENSNLHVEITGVGQATVTVKFKLSYPIGGKKEFSITLDFNVTRKDI